MKHKWILITVLLLIAAICLALWIMASGEASNFGLNAFTETLGILVTVVLVDELLRRREDIRTLPLKFAAYQDCRLLAARTVGFWADAHARSVPGKRLTTVEQLFTKEAFADMSMNLSLDAAAPVAPPRPWWDWLPESLKAQKDIASLIIQRHSAVLAPEIYLHVHSLANVMDLELIRTMRQYDLQQSFPRVRVLGAYHFSSPTYLEDVLALSKWCAKSSDYFSNHKLNNLIKFEMTLPSSAEIPNPDSMIDPEELLRQVKAQAAAQNRPS